MEIIRDIFEKRFSYPDRHLFAAIATVSDSKPNIRTMRIYGLEPDGSPVLTTHTGSTKWKEWERIPRVSLCILSDDKTLQLVCKGMVLLEDASSLKAGIYWPLIRPDVQETYGGKETVISPTFGVITVQPQFWEVRELVIPHRESTKTQYHLTADGWTETIL